MRPLLLVLMTAATTLSAQNQNNINGGCPIATTGNRGCVKPDGTTITVDGAGVISSAGGGGTPGGTNTAVQFNNSGAFGGDATNFNYNSASHVLSILGGLGIGATAPAVTFGTGGGVMSTEGTAPTVGFPAASVDGCYADSTSHTYKCSFNNSALFKLITDADSGTVTNTMLAGSVALTKLATQAADTVVINASGSTAAPTAVAMPTCTTGADLYNTSTHAWSCVSGTHQYGGTFGTPGGATLSTGGVQYFVIPQACTINAWNILVDTGTATVKFWKIASGTALPTVANVLNSSGVAISTGTAVHSTTVSDFTSTTVTAHDIGAVTLTAVATAGYVQATFECQ